MQNFRPHLLIILLASLLLTAPESHAEKTLRGKLRTKTGLNTGQQQMKPQMDTIVVFDTIRPSSQSDIRLSGYDKPLNSRKESLFVDNRLPHEITALEIRLTYSDMTGRMLHETVREIRADIPAGTTRRIEFPSWDRQNSFYYHKGRKPRVDNVTPYKVSCTVISYITPSTDSKQK